MYIFEKGVMMPICAVVGGIYINYWTGEVIEDKNTVKFIDKKMKNKSFYLKRDVDLKIYKIPHCFYDLEGYDFCLNGCHNYLNKDHQPFSKQQADYLKLQLSQLKLELIWGD